MNKTQLRIAAKMLDMASDEFANHGCNDFELPNTLENLLFVNEMIAESDYPDDELSLSEDQSVIYTMDWKVMDYLARVLEKEAENA